jgi:putative FmdB family regulatory protein
MLSSVYNIVQTKLGNLNFRIHSPMPTYDYVCDGCEHAFEQWQSFHDDALTKCPKCKKAKLRRLFGGGAAILFKGSGFYETDYNRSDSYKSAEKAEKDSKSETKSESKTETKSKK